MPFPPKADQKTWRFRYDTGTSDSPTSWLAAEQVETPWIPGFVFRVRFGLQEYTGNLGTLTLLPQLRVRKNGGSWQDVNGSSTIVRSADGSRADGVACGVHHLSTGLSGTHQGSSGYDDVDGKSGSGSLGTNNHYETEFACVVQAADVAHNDLLEFRVEEASNIDVWTSLARMRVMVPAGSGRLSMPGDGRLAGLAATQGAASAAESSLAILRAQGNVAGLAALQHVATSALAGTGSAAGSLILQVQSESLLAAQAILRGDTLLASRSAAAAHGLALVAGEVSLSQEDAAALAGLAAIQGALSLALHAERLGEAVEVAAAILRVLDVAEVGSLRETAAIGTVRSEEEAARVIDQASIGQTVDSGEVGPRSAEVEPF